MFAPHIARKLGAAFKRRNGDENMAADSEWHIIVSRDVPKLRHCRGSG